MGFSLGSILSSVAGPIAGYFGGPLAGSIATGLSSAYGASQQNSLNRGITAQQQAFQQYNSDTAYQRSMADMRAAGLNPILAYKQGGASSPSGAGIPAVNEAEGAINSAMASRRLQADIKNLEETNKNIKANTAKSIAETDFTRSKIDIAKVPATVSKNVGTVIENLIDRFLDPSKPDPTAKNATPKIKWNRAIGRNWQKVKKQIELIKSGKTTKADGKAVIHRYILDNPPTNKGFY